VSAERAEDRTCCEDTASWNTRCPRYTMTAFLTVAATLSVSDDVYWMTAHVAAFTTRPSMPAVANTSGLSAIIPNRFSRAAHTPARPITQR
jgi:hypothetical protein